MRNESATDQYGNTPLHRAIRYDQTEIAVELIGNGADVKAIDNEGFTPLTLAAHLGHTEIALALIANGADCNTADKNGNTPLHHAANYGHTEIAVALIENDADVNAVDRNGKTPLQNAAIKGHTETAVALIEKGADVNTADQNGSTPLHLAAFTGHTATAVALIGKGADCNTADKNGNTPLHYAAVYGSTETAVELIGNGADVNAVDGHGRTPLQIATMRVQNETARAIEHPLHWAASNSDVKTVKALIDMKYGTKDKLDNKTPLEHAIAADNLNVAKYLIALTKPNFVDLSMPEADNNTTTFLKLAALVPDTSADSALAPGSSATQDNLAKRIQNSKICFAKTLFGIHTTDKAKTMVELMMFNFTYKVKNSYIAAIVIKNGLVNSHETDKGLERPALIPDAIGIISSFAGYLPEEISIDAIANPYLNALSSRQMASSEAAERNPSRQEESKTNSGPGSPAPTA